MRHEFTRKTKVAAYERCKINGIACCEGVLPSGERCGLPLQVGRFTYDHRDPDFFSSDNSLENCQVLGWCCDRPKTAKDQGDIAKVKRVRDKHIGAFPKHRGFRGWRRFNGERVWAGK